MPDVHGEARAGSAPVAPVQAQCRERCVGLGGGMRVVASPIVGAASPVQSRGCMLLSAPARSRSHSRSSAHRVSAAERARGAHCLLLPQPRRRARGRGQHVPHSIRALRTRRSCGCAFDASDRSSSSAGSAAPPACAPAACRGVACGQRCCVQRTSGGAGVAAGPRGRRGRGRGGAWGQQRTRWRWCVVGSPSSRRQRAGLG